MGLIWQSSFWKRTTMSRIDQKSIYNQHRTNQSHLPPPTIKVALWRRVGCKLFVKNHEHVEGGVSKPHQIGSVQPRRTVSRPGFFEMPEYTAETYAFGPLKLLESILNSGMSSKTRLYQASTSELYGKVQKFRKRNDPFLPSVSVRCVKIVCFLDCEELQRVVRNVRLQRYPVFKHESERRAHNFVTRKITIGLNKILQGESSCLTMGNIDAMRDWGHAEDYVEGMWRMLQRDEPMILSWQPVKCTLSGNL